MEISQEIVQRLFIYDNTLGILTWRESGKGRRKRVGCYNNADKHWYVNINKKRYPLHRIIYLYHKGSYEPYLDHIDTDPSNNRIENLRIATHQQNCFNKGIKKNNKSGRVGVYWDNTHQKYCAEITYNRKKIHLGYYKDLEEASRAYQAKARELFKEFYYEGNK